MNVYEELKQLIRENFMISEEVSLSEDTELIQDLQMDSVSLMQLIVEVEEHFQISFEDVDLLAENFSRFGDFCRLIEETIGTKEKSDVILE